jgi:hypothetical protein
MILTTRIYRGIPPLFAIPSGSAADTFSISSIALLCSVGSRGSQVAYGGTVLRTCILIHVNPPEPLAHT